MLRIFAGYEKREAAGFAVFMESLLATTKAYVSVTPLRGQQLDGTNAFTYARFEVPYLCDFSGTAIFLDASDMLMRDDIANLAALADPRYAVQVVKHDYKTQHPRKYLGTDMESDNRDYPRKNWSSVVIWNCAHPKHRWMEPEALKNCSGSFLHRFQWLRDDEIGELPESWNVLIGEKQEAKIAHFTLGLPNLPAYTDSLYSDEWREHGNNSGSDSHGLDRSINYCAGIRF